MLNHKKAKHLCWRMELSTDITTEI